ncbi:ubiquinol oxidase subunit II [Burkholderia pseudomallei]|uniref:Uncharacterized protein n=4 Tax=pseudomallei group TaxID=111527 RepID=A2S0B1_BURM9|nr:MULTISPECIES: hypothetical protein [Burkholderia]MCE2036110.1 ubiquinol oxidase subunit II [Burkholderia pseudomallei CS]MCE2042141.1 ubiquinol oxidase subunit II [Burkholderia pseudomallei CB]MCE2048255.1 ubiquinol oxidase subunit II [Burkholderia pseudomallei OS]MCE2054299.1 ubiquinol oxidase subunit II [Burkholderia pseudomallei OB]ABM49140.1 hypothetical protein BMASAVP1_1384 [Burkholderia mallei SAVP1]
MARRETAEGGAIRHVGTPSGIGRNETSNRRRGRPVHRAKAF